MPKGKSNECKQGIHRETVHNILDESQVEPSLVQCRRDYVALAPTSVKIIKRAIEGGPVDKDLLWTAFQILKGTGVHEERARSKNNVKISQDLTHLSDDELNESIQELLTPKPFRTT